MLDRFSPILHLVQSIRDEAHRFAVTFHRSRRNARQLTSELDEIPGVGKMTVQKLLKEFGSSELVRAADRGRTGGGGGTRRGAQGQGALCILAACAALIPILLFLSLHRRWARRRRREIATAVSPADAKPNNPDVPEVQSIPTQFERVVVLRFKYETELLSGLEQAVKQNKIRNGVILNGFGSVRNYQIHQVSNRTLPSKNMFVKDPTRPGGHRGHERLRAERPAAPAHHAGESGKGLRAATWSRAQTFSRSRW